ncbi:MAG: rRNA maturation RNase YbeY [Planctomycetes bacterium]|nr:rRNA maturation RNase YbeY [Planctomycetota bacterium]
MITVQIAEECQPLKVSLSRLEALIVSICSRFSVTDALVSVVIVDDRQIALCNRDFLGHEETTDSISFDLSDGFEKARVFNVIVNGEKALQEATLRNHSPEAELALYVTHGMLHNFGYDDLEEKLAREMHQLEDAILEDFGYGIVYDTAKKG